MTVPPEAPSAALLDSAFVAGVDQCVRCGLCLPSCPTYLVLKNETDSPRGRISLMGAAAEGRIPIEGAFTQHIDRCLGCRACEVACPSGVAYGHLWERARVATTQRVPIRGFRALVRWVLLRVVLPNRRALDALARLGRAANVLRIPALTQRVPSVPRSVQVLASLSPPRRELKPRSSRRVASVAGSEPVHVFRGCVQPAFLPEIHEATHRVLAASGKRVHEPEHQTCCGALHLHLGEPELARRLARRNIDAFAGQPGPIVSNAGGCGAMLKEYAHLLADDPSYAAAARQFSDSIRDVSELLTVSRREPPAPIATRVTYVDSCHLRNVQKVTDAPRALLRALPGVELVELARPDLCCGSAGVYNLLEPDIADRVLDEKVADLRRADPDVVVVSNPGCFLQVARGVRDGGMRARVVHLVELIDELQTETEETTS